MRTISSCRMAKTVHPPHGSRGSPARRGHLRSREQPRNRSRSNPSPGRGASVPMRRSPFRNPAPRPHRKRPTGECPGRNADSSRRHRIADPLPHRHRALSGRQRPGENRSRGLRRSVRQPSRQVLGRSRHRPPSRSARVPKRRRLAFLRRKNAVMTRPHCLLPGCPTEPSKDERMALAVHPTQPLNRWRGQTLRPRRLLSPDHRRTQHRLLHRCHQRRTPPNLDRWPGIPIRRPSSRRRPCRYLPTLPQRKAPRQRRCWKQRDASSTHSWGLIRVWRRFIGGRTRRAWRHRIGRTPSPMGM